MKLQSRPHAADAGGVGLSASSFADMYAAHMPELTRYCRGILRDRHDAEDAAQNAMERALRALTDGPPPDRMRPWLFTIAQRESIAVLRGRGRTAGNGGLEAQAAGASAEELSAVRERLAELLADVRALTPRQREVLVARELGGQPYRQIASSLGITERAAQQLVLEARQSLRQFQDGRSLECQDVQAWISAHEHARVRTRRVRAHLRACSGCRGFQHGIATRRRDFGLLLPGVAGGGALWSWLGALLAHGGAKLAAAGAIAVTGATLAATAPGLDGPVPSAPRPPVASAGEAAPARLVARSSRIAGVSRPVRAAARRSRTAGPAGAGPAIRRPRVPVRRSDGARPHPRAGAGPAQATATPPARAPAATPAPAPPVATPPAPAAPQQTTASPLPAPAQPLVDAVEPVMGDLVGAVEDVAGALPLPDRPKLP